MIVGRRLGTLKGIFNQIPLLFQVVFQYSSIMFIRKDSNLVSIQVYVHSALYFSARGTLTCQGRPGSFGYEVKDANTYANWNVDYLKMDTCQHTGGRPAEVEYLIMRLEDRYFCLYVVCTETDQDLLSIVLFFSGGVNESDLWPPNVGNSWRTTRDIRNNWTSMISNIQLVNN